MINFIRAKFRNQREITTSSTAVSKSESLLNEQEHPNAAAAPINTVSPDDESKLDKDSDNNFYENEQQNLIESTTNSVENEDDTDEEEIQPEPDYYYGENSDEDSDPYGYREEMLGQNRTSSDYDY